MGPVTQTEHQYRIILTNTIAVTVLAPWTGRSGCGTIGEEHPKRNTAGLRWGAGLENDGPVVSVMPPATVPLCPFPSRHRQEGKPCKDDPGADHARRRLLQVREETAMRVMGLRLRAPRVGRTGLYLALGGWLCLASSAAWAAPDGAPDGALDGGGPTAPPEPKLYGAPQANPLRTATRPVQGGIDGPRVTAQPRPAVMAAPADMDRLAAEPAQRLALAEANATAPAGGGKQTAMVQPGVSRVFPLAKGHYNRVITPFTMVGVRTMSSEMIEVQGNILYIAPRGDEPITMFLVEEGDESRSMNVAFIPSDVPPVELYLEFGGSGSAQAGSKAPVSLAGPVALGAGIAGAAAATTTAPSGRAADPPAPPVPGGTLFDPGGDPLAPPASASPLPGTITIGGPVDNSLGGPAASGGGTGASVLAGAGAAAGAEETVAMAGGTADLSPAAALMQSLAGGAVPDGYSLQPTISRAEDARFCAQTPGFTVTFLGGQHVKGDAYEAFIGVVHNHGVTIQEFKESWCGGADVAAVGLWPAAMMYPGERAEIFVVRRIPPPLPENHRPSLLQSTRTAAR